MDGPQSGPQVTPLFPGPSPPGPMSNNGPFTPGPGQGPGPGGPPFGPPSYSPSPVAIPPGPGTPGAGPGPQATPPNHYPSPGFPSNAGPPFNGPTSTPFGSPSGPGGFPSGPGPHPHPHFGNSGPSPVGPPTSGFGGGPPFGPGHPFVGHPGGPMSLPGPQMGGPPMGGPMGGPNMGPMSGPPHPMGDRIEHGAPFFGRRHTPYFGQPDYRVYELNKRLQQRTEESDNLWWDAFVTEFFEDDATLTLTFCLEDGPKRYTIGRTLIPRYFRSIFEGGVTDLHFVLKQPKESFHTTSITLDCEQSAMITQHGKPMFTKYPVEVITEGRLILDFTFDDLMRIKSWHFAVRAHRELVPRSVLALHAAQQDPTLLDQFSKNVTRQGITPATLNYLRLCVILEPMQELMSRHKAYALSPRDCLKTTLFQKWQRMVAPPESQRPPNKRRKRKGAVNNNNANNSSGPGNSTPTPAQNKKRSPGPNFALASQDVMVVGEPSLMGGEFGDEDERLITRLENTQYDSSVLDDGGGGGGSNGPFPEHPGAWSDSRMKGGPGGSNGPDPGKKSPAISQ